MNTIWTFGDSFTEGFDQKAWWSEEYIKWKGYVPKVYGEILSEKLGFKLKNYGKGGSDNYTIFQNFCDVSDMIKPNDFVIFGWSSPIRFRLLRANGTWEYVVPNFDENLRMVENVSISSLKEILAHRDHDMFIWEVNSWIKLITTFLNAINVDIIHWNTFDYKINAKYIQELERVHFDTKGEINDAHFSENDQKELANILLNMYRNKTTNLI